MLAAIAGVSLFGMIVTHHPSALWHYAVLYFSCMGFMLSLIHITANAVDILVERLGK